MNKTAAPHRWFASWRAERRAPQDDPADYGTAFGLDMSMLDAADTEPPPLPVARRPGWVERLAARRRPAA